LAEDAFDGLGIQLGNFVRAQLSFTTFQVALTGVADRAREAADYIQGIAKEFTYLQQSLQHVPALIRTSNKSQFAVAQASQFALGSPLTEQWRAVRGQFKSCASAQLEHPTTKLTADQSQIYERKVVEVAEAGGISRAQAAESAGSLLEDSQRPQVVDNRMEKLFRTLLTLDRSRTPVGRLLPQLSRIIGFGTTGEEAAQLLAVIALAMPNQDQAGVENTFEAIRQLEFSGRAGECGTQDGMSPLQKVKAPAQNVHDRTIAGEDLGHMLQYAKIGDMREFRGVHTFVQQGVGMEGFDRIRRFREETPRSVVDDPLHVHEKTDVGHHAGRTAQLADEEMARAERIMLGEALQAEAGNASTEEGRSGRDNLTDWARSGVGSLTVVNTNEQFVQEPAYELARLQRGVVPDAASKGPFLRAPGPDHYQISGAGATRGEATELILAELKKLTDMMRQNAIAPIAAPPPVVHGARMGA
jgi:hypothetical protein